MFLLSMNGITTWGQDVDYRAQAKAENRQLDVLLSKLSSISDSTYYYESVKRIVKTAIQCENFDGRPDRKGRTHPKYREKNSERVSPVREQLLSAANYYMTQRLNQKALEAFELYVDTSINPLFDNLPKRDGLISYYASLLAYGIKDFKKAESYADIALTDTNYAKDAAEIKINCMKNRLFSREDSAKYVMALLELHDKAPENSNYFSMLVDYFTQPGHEKELRQFAKDEVQKDRQNTIAWVLKGETDMQQKDWDAAIASYLQVAKLDSSIVPAIYNIGICYSSKAIELKNKISLHKEKFSKEESETILSLFNQAIAYLEKTRQKDPQQRIVAWASPLYQALYAVGRRKEAKSIKALMN